MMDAADLTPCKRSMIMKKITLKLLTAIAANALTTTIASAQEMSQDEVADMIANPLSYLWMMAMQNDTIFMDGDIPGADKIAVNRFTIMPVMPFQLTENHKLMFRPWLPIMSSELPWGDRNNFKYTETSFGNLPTGIKDTDWKSGLGDMGFWAMLANSEGTKPPFIYGLGLTTMFDTASKDQFGLGKNSAGPTGLAFYVGERWVVGGILQHWWSYAGDDDRDDVSLTDFQYILRYRISKTVSIGCMPNIQYNWETDSLTLPVGLGVDKLFMVGKLPVKIGVEAYYNTVNEPDALQNDWHARIFMIPVLPSPKWSRNPLF
jgi:hypothetical protein